jgi:SM-20-related protein
LTLGGYEVERFGEGFALVRDGLLGPALAAAVLAELPSYEPLLVQGGMGRLARRWFDTTERGDEMAWLEPDEIGPALKLLWSRFEALRQALVEEAWLGLRRFDVQVAQYRVPGARYGRHADAFEVQPRRRATAIYYANPSWQPADGGMLRVYEPTGERDIEPLLDRLVVFRSDHLEHEVLASYALRTAITAWYYPD